MVLNLFWPMDHLEKNPMDHFVILTPAQEQLVETVLHINQ